MIAPRRQALAVAWPALVPPRRRRGERVALAAQRRPCRDRWVTLLREVLVHDRSCSQC